MTTRGHQCSTYCELNSVNTLFSSLCVHQRGFHSQATATYHCVCLCLVECWSLGLFPVSSLGQSLQLTGEAQTYGPVLITGSPGNSVQSVSHSLGGKGERQGTVAEHGCSQKPTFNSGVCCSVHYKIITQVTGESSLSTEGIVCFERQSQLTNQSNLL